MKLRNAIGALGALVFGVTPAPSHAANAGEPQRAEPAPPAAKPKVRLHQRLFKNERERQEKCKFLDAWRDSIARNDRQSAKFLRRLDLEIAATRNPTVFERGKT